MSAPEEPDLPLPQEPLACRQNAEQNLFHQKPVPENAAFATAWALLAIAGELAEIRRELRRRR
jgi:hypothetical protein